MQPRRGQLLVSGDCAQVEAECSLSPLRNWAKLFSEQGCCRAKVVIRGGHVDQFEIGNGPQQRIERAKHALELRRGQQPFVDKDEAHQRGGGLCWVCERNHGRLVVRTQTAVSGRDNLDINASGAAKVIELRIVVFKITLAVVFEHVVEAHEPRSHVGVALDAPVLGVGCANEPVDRLIEEVIDLPPMQGVEQLDVAGDAAFSRKRMTMEPLLRSMK